MGSSDNIHSGGRRLERRLIRSLAGRLLPMFGRRYLSKERNWKYKGLNIQVQPGVFHPGMFFSTRILIDFLEKQPLQGKSFWELGCGSGAISVFAALQGAKVTASDISTKAVAAAKENAKKHSVELTALHSDLFKAIPEQQFDQIVINPPYYPGVPQKEEDFAWYCGPDFEYFDLLFSDLGKFCHGESKVWMILSEDCRLDRIQELGIPYGWKMELSLKKKVWGEWNYIFSLQH